MRDPVESGGRQPWEPEPLHLPLHQPPKRDDEDPDRDRAAPAEQPPQSRVIVIDLC